MLKIEQKGPVQVIWPICNLFKSHDKKRNNSCHQCPARLQTCPENKVLFNLVLELGREVLIPILQSGPTVGHLILWRMSAISGSSENQTLNAFGLTFVFPVRSDSNWSAGEMRNRIPNMPIWYGCATVRCDHPGSTILYTILYIYIFMSHHTHI